MAVFQYRALGENGAETRGEISALSRAEAYRLLRDRSLRPLEVSESASSSQLPNSRAPDGPLRLSAQQILDFTEELAELIEAGLQLEGALKVMASRGEASGIRSAAARLRQSVRDGLSFSNALRECGGAFDPLYCNMAAAGEESGALPQILRSQCAHMALMGELRRRVTSSLLYPSIVFAAALVLIFVFLAFLVPQLSVLLSKTGQKLPAITQALIAVSTFVGKWWWALLAAAGASVLLFKFFLSTPRGRAWWDRALLDAPVVGPVLRARFYAEVLQTLSTLVANGVTLLQGLQLLPGATANVFLSGLLQRASAMIGEGSALSSAFRRLGFFPAALCDILAVGEQTGDISGALARAAKRYDRELTAHIERLTTLVQPAIILFVALVVGLVAYSMIAGILTSVNALRVR